jgi:hypothetical protein
MCMNRSSQSSSKKKKADKRSGSEAPSPACATAVVVAPSAWLVSKDSVKRGSSSDGDLLDFVHAVVQLNPDDFEVCGFIPDSCVLVQIATRHPTAAEPTLTPVGIGRIWPCLAVKKARLGCCCHSRTCAHRLSWCSSRCGRAWIDAGFRAPGLAPVQPARGGIQERHDIRCTSAICLSHHWLACCAHGARRALGDPDHAAQRIGRPGDVIRVADHVLLYPSAVHSTADACDAVRTTTASLLDSLLDDPALSGTKSAAHIRLSCCRIVVVVVVVIVVAIISSRYSSQFHKISCPLCACIIDCFFCGDSQRL